MRATVHSILALFQTYTFSKVQILTQIALIQ